MKLKYFQPKATAEQVVKAIRSATRRHYSTEDKIRIVLSGLRGELGGADRFYRLGNMRCPLNRESAVCSFRSVEQRYHCKPPWKPRRAYSATYLQNFL